MNHTPLGKRRWQLVQVEISIACNLECVMCPWTCERECARHEGLMPESVWRAIALHLDRIASLDFGGGGEPLLHAGLFDRMAEAKAAKCRVGFLTNGTLMDVDAVETILEIGVDWVAVSIDGATAEVYESIRKGAKFETVCGNIERLAARRSEGRPRLMINFLMMPATIHELRRTVRRARRFGEKFGIEVTQPWFQPEEKPVCDQDPRTALFVRYDGKMALHQSRHRRAEFVPW